MTDFFPYKCPDCGTTRRVHDFDCKYEFTSLEEFERPYIDIISTLSQYMATMKAYDLDAGMSMELLVEQVESSPKYSDQSEEIYTLESVSEEVRIEDTPPPTQSWSELHSDCFDCLMQERRIQTRDDGLVLVRPEERKEQIIPAFEPLQTIYEHGPVNGAKDYSVYTMMSWCSLKDMTWEQTCNFVKEWLRDTNAWERESWGEPTMQALCNEKKHVWANDLGWGGMAEAAKSEIESSDVESQIDAVSRIGKEASDYE